MPNSPNHQDSPKAREVLAWINLKLIKNSDKAINCEPDSNFQESSMSAYDVAKMQFSLKHWDAALNQMAFRMLETQQVKMGEELRRIEAELEKILSHLGLSTEELSPGSEDDKRPPYAD